MQKGIAAGIGTLALAAGIGLSACGGGYSSSTAAPAGHAATSQPTPPASGVTGQPVGSAPSSTAMPTPPAAAVVTWQSTPQDTPGTGPDDVGNSFQAIAGILNSTGQVPDPFTAQEALLNQLAGMSSLTGPQAQKDIAALNQFFGTPGLQPAGG
jgi:hypothetical protein